MVENWDINIDRIFFGFLFEMVWKYLEMLLGDRKFFPTVLEKHLQPFHDFIRVFSD